MIPAKKGRISFLLYNVTRYINHSLGALNPSSNWPTRSTIHFYHLCEVFSFYFGCIFPFSFRGREDIKFYGWGGKEDLKDTEIRKYALNSLQTNILNKTFAF